MPVMDDVLAPALALTAADYAAVWQRFRSAIARNAVAGGKITDFPDAPIPVIGLNGIRAQADSLQNNKMTIFDLGVRAMLGKRLPYNSFATVIIEVMDDTRRYVVFVSRDEAAGDGVTASLFGEWDARWAFVMRSRLGDRALERDVNGEFGLDQEGVEKLMFLMWKDLSLLIGLMSMPTDVVIRSAVSRPLSKGRVKPHPLAPSNLLLLSFDPHRLVSSLTTHHQGTHASPSFPFHRRGTIVTNKKGTTFERRPTVVMKNLPGRDHVRVAKLADNASTSASRPEATADA